MAARWIVVAVVAAFFVGRRPASLFAPQFWAEDGRNFYGGELVNGVRSLFEPYAGYLHLVPRLTSVLAAHAPVSLAPAIFAFSAYVCAIWACTLFAAPRYRSIVASDGLRYVACLAFAVVPSANELIGTIANAHSYLALGAFLLLAGEEPAGPKRQIRLLLYSCIVLLAALSSPEIILFVPFAIWKILKSTDRAVPISILLGAAAQLSTLASNRVSDSAVHVPLVVALKATVFAFVHRVVIGTIAGDHVSGEISHAHATGIALAILVATVLGLVALVCREPASRVAVLSLLGGAMLLIWSAVEGRGLAGFFPSLGTIYYGGERYFFLPAVAFITIVAIAVDHIRPLPEQAKTVILAACFLSGGIWNYHPAELMELHWPQYVPSVDAWIRAQRSGRKSSAVSVPINPPGWFIDLPSRQ